jgi:hypothetical protein
VSISQQISGTLAAEWGLAGTLAPTEMHFSVGWFDSEYMNNPQVSVRKAWTPEPFWFMPAAVGGVLGYLSFPRYFVDYWLPSDHDILGESEYDTVENMMFEGFRILNLKRLDFTAPLGLVIPLGHGEMMSEFNTQPYILHIQMLVQANIRSGTC